MRKAIFTEHVPTPRGYYSQGVRVNDHVYISGQLPLNHAGELVGQTAGEQTRFVMEHVRYILQAEGGDLHDLVQVTVYITNVEHWPEINAVYREMLSDTPFPPARAVVPVKELHYGALVEIQGIAHLRK